MSRLTGKNAQILAESTRTSVVVAQTMTDSGDHKTYSFQSLWDSSKTPTITKNAVVVDPSAFTIDYIAGTITFAVANLIGDVIKVNLIDYITLAVVADMYDWTVDAKIDVADATAFQDQFHTKLSSFRGWVAKASAYHRSDFWFPLFSAAKPCYVKLYPDASTTDYFVGNGFVSFGEKAPAGGVVVDSVSIEGTGALLHKTS